MADSPDQSHLDLKYFIDERTYNCPFCNRRHVSYRLVGARLAFDWAVDKQCYVFFARCDSCKRVSMHLTFRELASVYQRYGDVYQFAKIEGDLDEFFFYSVPTSFFVMDDRIPSIIRELITEAEGSQKMNFLTGASACARKAIYEFLVLQGAEGVHYDDKIKDVKQRFSHIDPDLFDVLGHIQDMTSDKVHEQSWPKWNAKNLTLMIESLKAILHEVYVVPAEKAGRSSKIRDLLAQVRKGASPAVDPAV